MNPTDNIAIRFHFGGTFVYVGKELHYMGGQTAMSTIELDKLSLPEIIGNLKDHVELSVVSIKLHWQIPRSQLNIGLSLLFDDKSCERMASHISHYEIANIYVEVPSVEYSDQEYDLQQNENQDVTTEINVEPKEVVHIGSEEVTPADFEEVIEEVQDAVSEAISSDSDSDFYAPVEDNSSGEDEEAIEMRRQAKEIKRKIKSKMLRDDLVKDLDVPYDSIIPDVTILDDGDLTPYFDSDEAMSYDEVNEGGEGHLMRRKSTHQMFDKKSTIPHYALDMAFHDSREFKKSLLKYGLATNRNLIFSKDEKQRVSAKCSWPGCPWSIYGSISSRSEWFLVVKFNDEHNCIPRRDNKLVTSSIIAKKYFRTIRDNPTWKAEHMQQSVLQDLLADVSLSKCKRAKMLVMQKIIDATDGEYSRVFDYHLELVRSNPGNTVAVCLNPDIYDAHVFQRMYVCFDACKKGFLAGCRRVVGLDGCFFKGAMGGELLCAIGRDGNNQMYPIAWASVEMESYDAWYWFLGLLLKDLQINNNGDGWVLISDQQKGLIRAVSELLPKVEHRMCARHIYANWKKRHGDKILQKMFWACAKSSDRTEFQHNRAKLAQQTVLGARDIMNTVPEHWSRAYFKLGSNCDSCENNLCESFNHSILRARFYPIISMLEIIRTKVMVRIQEKRDKAAKWSGTICPNIFTKLKLNIKRSSQCHVLWNGKEGFEVKENEKRRFTVNLQLRTCSCRYWQMSGLPCCHAISAIYTCSQKLDDYIAECYSISEYKKTYDHVLQPVDGQERWPVSENPKPSPPIHIRMPGRPKTARKRETGEKVKGQKLTRVGCKVKCSLCGKNTHNKRTCSKNPEVGNKQNASFVRASKRRATSTQAANTQPVQQVHDVPASRSTPPNDHASAPIHAIHVPTSQSMHLVHVPASQPVHSQSEGPSSRPIASSTPQPKTHRGRKKGRPENLLLGSEN